MRLWVTLTTAMMVLGLSACGDVDPEDETTPTGKTINKDGGFVASEDGVLTIVFPPGALPDATLVTIGATVDVPASIGPAYRVTPNIDLDVPAIIAYRYSLPAIEGATRSTSRSESSRARSGLLPKRGRSTSSRSRSPARIPPVVRVRPHRGCRGRRRR